MSAQIDALVLLKLLQSIATKHGASLTAPGTLMPIWAHKNAKSEFDFGVLACVAEIYWLVGQTLDGRKAIYDLGFEPLFQHVEGE